MLFPKTDILVVGARGIPNVEGGAEKHAEMAFPILVEYGLSVTLLAIKGYAKKGSFKGVRIVALPSLKFAQTDKPLYHFLCVLYAILSRPKIVHLQGLNAALFLIGYRIFGLRVVLRYASADHLHKKWGFLGRIAFKVCELQVRFANHVIAVSDTYKRELENRYGIMNITVIPNGVDPIQVSPVSEQFFADCKIGDTPFVLSVGRLTVDKDFETLIQAVESVSESKLRVIIAGGSSERGYSEKLFEKAGDHVRFLGKIDRPLLASLYKNCSIYTNTSHFEGQSNALLEAISNNCPIVASDIAANRELNLPKESYFPVGDAEILSEKLRLALRKPDLFVASKESYPNWDNVAERMARLYLLLMPSLEISSNKSHHSFEKAD